MITGILTAISLFSILSAVSSTQFYADELQVSHETVLLNYSNPPKLFSCGYVMVGLKSRFKTYRQPIIPQRNKTLLHLALLLLSISCDVESNPGPNYPCGSCGAEVYNNDPAVECDTCERWFHINCQNLDLHWYNQILENDTTLIWSCTNCDSINQSYAPGNTSIQTQNSFIALSETASKSHTTNNFNSKQNTHGQNKQHNFVSRIKVLLVNCQSIVNKKQDFQNIVYTYNPDVVAGTESWLTKDHYTAEIFPPDMGYTVFRRDRLSGKGGGVFIMAKNNLQPTIQTQLNTNCEIIWVKLKTSGAKPLYISSFYKPHEMDIGSILELEKSLDLARKLRGNILLLGDFNLPKLTWDSEHLPSIKPGCNTGPVYDKFLNLIDDHCLTQMVNESTRYENILDLLLTSNPTLINSIQIVPGISDHDAVLSSINTRPAILKQKTRDCPIYKKADWHNFKQFMTSSKADILQDKESISVECLWNKFKKAIETGISKFVPIKRIGSKKSLPWITKELQKLMHKRDRLYSKLKKNKSNPHARASFKSIKALIKQKIKASYDSFLEGILEINGDEQNSKFSTKKLYTLIKNSKQDSQSIQPLVDQKTGTLKSNSKDKANILNTQFQSVFSGCSPLSLKQTCLQKLRDINPTNFCRFPQMDDIVVSENGVLKLLADIKVDKAGGPDLIKPLVLKELRNEIYDIITVLFQKSLSTGDIPSDWTKAFVCPIYKKGDTSDPANYRPISLTCILCKTLEHIVASALSSHFDKHNILFDLQHGFREKRSCETQLIQLTDFLINNLAKGKQTDLILLDFSKAFDKVNHLKLIHTLQEHGVSQQILRWTRSFLIGRTQTVVIDGECSSDAPVTSGVPQGSVLGPLCFLLYINQLPSAVTSPIRLFADDTAVYLTINSPSDSLHLQEDLAKMEVWEKEWDMEFNPSKCQVLHITRNKQPIKYQYSLHGQTIESASSAKYLGLDLSSDMSYNTHISRITAKANKTLGFVKRNITTKNENVRQLAYKTLVRPQVEYASSIWSPFTKSNINKIEMVQRRAARWVKHDYSPYSSVTSIQSELGWRSLEHRRYDSRLIMFFKIYHNLVAISLPPYIQRPTRFTRHMHPFCLRQVQVSSDYRKWSFFPHCVTLWNALPADVAALPPTELDQFRRAVACIQY